MTVITRNDKADGRTYTIDGEEYPSNTSVLSIIAKPALVPWAKKVSLEKARAELYAYVDDPLFGGQRIIERADVDRIIEVARKRPDEVRDDAADFGSRAHGMIEAYLLNKPYQVTDELRPVMDNFLAWYKSNSFTITCSERVVYSKTHRFAGTLDAMATRGGLPVVLDWKTSNGLWPEHRLQVAGYALAVTEMEKVNINETWIVRFAKDRPKKPEDAFEAFCLSGKALADAQSAFLSALWLWRWHRTVTEWR